MEMMRHQERNDRKSPDTLAKVPSASRFELWQSIVVNS